MSLAGRIVKDTIRIQFLGKLRFVNVNILCCPLNSTSERSVTSHPGAESVNLILPGIPMWLPCESDAG